ncbi:mediator of RNA polymerase II transcription subunit 19 [Diplogelasinospora grovesii]|uniref:Mediator of RNA polymerase II transcription subunit 19 n=1 Tax=Diplogelasinospora grovesii TaxID=303347 RepID=A0AAN6NJB4_9PEZI|nr:mediator of RNA polymerase II transcription subunit 19 [Diplogelasinospora grovesii]
MSFHPSTPQSPSQLSPCTSDPSTITTNPNSSMTSVTNTLPTPTHSVNGSSGPSETAQDIVMGDDTPHKRKRELDDLGEERELKKVHIEDRRLGIENLHLDVGDKYLLCRTPHPAPRPQVSEDLFERYGLTALAAEVARVLPNGEKNAIRKTYKGHIKKLGVNGHFDSVKQDPHRQDGFLSIMRCPDDEWNVHFVRGKEIENGFAPETRARLVKATTMAKGVVPKSMWDSSVLGEVGPGKGEKQTTSARPTAPNTPSASIIGLPRPTKPLPQSAAVGAQDANRPKRNVKKRGYGDSSFEGYGDGYPDDDLGGDTGYSTGEGDMVNAQKRRKKVPID